MNKYQLTMYNDLMSLVESSESFFFKDFIQDNVIYRVFNYRMTSYSEFLAPSALECRGHMFVVSFDGSEPLEMSALPMEKFFNIGENPFTMDIDLSTIKNAMVKADGSLISTYMHNGDLRLKSKGSLSSDQAKAAMKWLDRKENEQFKNELVAAERLECTINMEWCAPDNRIVLGYMEPHLIVLNIRNRVDGSYINYKDINCDRFPKTLRHWVEYYKMDDKAQFVADIPDMQDIEGFVLQLESGQHIKVKTLWYLALHHTKDSINNPRRLFECVLEETSDDLRQLFFDDELAIKLIEEMEAKVEKVYNHVVDTTERFYETNKHLDRKDYAILGQAELERMWFSLAMNKYIEREFSYKDCIKSKWKQLGFKDEKVEDDE